MLDDRVFRYRIGNCRRFRCIGFGLGSARRRSNRRCLGCVGFGLRRSFRRRLSRIGLGFGICLCGSNGSRLGGVRRGFPFGRQRRTRQCRYFGLVGLRGFNGRDVGNRTSQRGLGRRKVGSLRLVDFSLRGFMGGQLRRHFGRRSGAVFRRRRPVRRHSAAFQLDTVNARYCLTSVRAAINQQAVVGRVVLRTFPCRNNPVNTVGHLFHGAQPVPRIRIKRPERLTV